MTVCYTLYYVKTNKDDGEKVMGLAMVAVSIGRSIVSVFMACAQLYRPTNSGKTHGRSLSSSMAFVEGNLGLFRTYGTGLSSFVDYVHLAAVTISVATGLPIPHHFFGCVGNFRRHGVGFASFAGHFPLVSNPFFHHPHSLVTPCLCTAVMGKI